MPYAEAVMRHVGLMDDDVIGDRVAGRIHRQGVLRKPNPPHLCAIIAENALHNLLGDKNIMREQLAFLIEAARRPNINLRVIPRSVGNHPGFDGPFLRLQFHDRCGVVFVGNRTSNLFLEDDEDRMVYNNVVVELLTVALDEEHSVALIRDLKARLAEEQS